GVFAGGPEALATLMSAQGAGALAGSFVLMRRRGNAAMTRIIVATGIGLCVTLIGFAALYWMGHASIALAVPLMVAAGIFHLIFNVATQTIIQSVAAPEFQGRTVSLYSLTWRAGAP